MIPFNKPFLTGKETQYIEDAVASGKLSGNGIFTKKCHAFFESKFGFKKCLLTTSCTDALEMCAILANISTDDEVIIPSYTFVSSAVAFVRQGAKIIFADSYKNNPNIDPQQIEQLITPKTKAIVIVHYAGIACDMDAIMAISKKHNLIVIEDAAQAIDSYYKGKPLGSFGHLAAFSFHETKNIISGEGGMLCINDEKLLLRSEIIWEKGTNRAQFFRGEVNKYGWMDIGSSFLPSEVIAAFLWAQLENLDAIQTKRKAIWNMYYNTLDSSNLERIKLPVVPNYASQNGHLFYIVCKSIEHRSHLIAYLKGEGVHAVFHYLSLHDSPYYAEKHDGRALKNSDMFSNRLLRLPLFYNLQLTEAENIANLIINYEQNN
ncbi:dTDP-4-amino-4,6-dideoxygalactose transaminase [Winogradskyella aurantia]|uniref:dTDP-4-amino-4,6-dideoxygalactose transaminase n=1 Tax=Winogradskyella aurantia TaxID=1915063 RepID=A0A265UXL6_9FLAO|nr:dTDP-4-amino-4,6-dideoxygalactose transaminase [Winogradskyella aurantia]OZV70036.1 dTDP-4-amino-4,6-dideoxygalactose transaminase [Winogradskyella aurantia]